MMRFNKPLHYFLLSFLTACLLLPTASLREDAGIKITPKLRAIDEAYQQEFDMTRDLSLNEVPRQRLQAAKAYADRMRNSPNYQRSAISGISWDERGPNNVSGRTRAILVDVNDATRNTLWAGSVGGGLWKTTNSKAATPAWTAVNELFGNLAVSCIMQDPNNSQNIYFGTGEGWFNSDAIRGLGIWKTSNGGTTWTQLSSTNNSTFYYVQKIEIDASGNVYACTRDGGIQKSTNGGTSWTKVLGSGASATTNRAADIEIAANGDLYAAMGVFSTDGIYKSTNNAVSWTKLSGGLPSTGYYRIELACAPSNSNKVYAMYCGTNYDCLGIYRTDNAGTNWTTLSNPAAYGMTNFCRGQAWYDLICAVDPNNDARVFIGGIDILVSGNSGSSWSQIAQWYGGGGYQEVHADQHAIVFEPGNSSVAYFGNDGGVFRSTNATAGTPAIDFIGDGYNVTQFFAGAIHPTAGVNTYLAGAQDNGSQYFTSAGINNTTEVTGGDGAFCHIDQDQPNIQISSYVRSQYRVTTNSWASYSNINYSSTNGLFINPTDYDDVNNVLYGAYTSNTYFYMTGVGSSNSTGVRTMTALGGTVSTVSVSPNTPTTVYFGTSGGEVVRVTSANTASASGTVIRSGSGTVSCVAIEDGNDDHMLVTYSNYGQVSVYETTNGGGSWTNVEGNLPDMPVRWALFAPDNNDHALLATELGVWSTDDLNGGSTNWGPSNTGFANVRTDMLQYRKSDNQIIAATHGRGLFSSDYYFTPPTCNTTVSSFPYSESFESGLGAWELGGGDFDWIRNSGSTPSSGTGPAAAYDGSWYMYVEASTPNYPSKTTIFNGPCFDLSGVSGPDFTFRYHMTGSSVGTLELQASTDQGATWSGAIWSLSGDQGTAWNPATVSLTSYVGSTVKLRFVGNTNTSWQGDMCVDDIGLSAGGAPPPTVTITNSTNISCNNGADGSINASASGGASPYSYSWTGPNGYTSSSQNITGLEAGTYIVTVTDANTNTDVDQVTLTEPSALGSSIVGTDESSPGANDGSADLTVSGGTPSYSYSWTGPNGFTASTQDISGLEGGTYDVTITDNNSCAINDQVVINTIIPPLVASIPGSSNSNCNGADNGSANGAASGGIAPYSYSWSGPNSYSSGSQNISGLAPGTYTLTVTDNNSSQDQAQVIITEPSAIASSITGTDESSPGANDGSADLTVSGGTPGYSYSWTGPNGFAASSQDISGLEGGTYDVTITDNNGCVGNDQVVINTGVATLVASASLVADVSCNGGSNGAANGSASGGQAPYSYSWAGPNSFSASTQNIGGLAAGLYTLTVTDNNNSQSQDQVTIGEPSALATAVSGVDESAPGAADGSADLTVGGGTPSYTYSWTGPNSFSASTEDITGLVGGTYDVTITDANGCSANDQVVIETGLVVNITGSTNLTCNSNNSGSATSAAAGGVLPYSYSWSGPLGYSASTASIASLAAGTYTVTVTDGNSNTAQDQVTLTEPGLISTAIAGTDESAPGASDGAADLGVSGGTPGYTYSWTGPNAFAASTEDITGLEGGTYDVTVTDANGCTANDQVTINTLTPSAGLQFDYGLVNAVSDTWQTITLSQAYTNMVVVATPVLPTSTDQPAVTRVRNASGNSFDLKIQVPGASATGTYDVHYVVVEAGQYNVTDDGVNMEAFTFNSSVTAENNNWAFEAQTYQNSYTSPVVLGQVMSENNTAWSVFWSSANGDRLSPASAASFAAGKNVSEDPVATRSDETVGVIVIESGNGSLNGVDFSAGVGADIVLGPDNNTIGYNYSLNGLATAEVAVLSTAGMDGGNGGWPVLFGASPVSATQLTMMFDEDQQSDTERAHTSEQVAYLVFEDTASSPPSSSLVFEQAKATNVSDSWQTITLQNTYASMVVVATAELPSNTGSPMVTRVRNASGNSFDLRVQNPSGNALSGITVNYMVAEEGVYTQAIDGITMEAVKVTSSQTARKNSWVHEARSYQQSYTSPVVLGQIMTENDAAWSVFWATNGSQNSPPSASAISAGKHVAEDVSTTRLDETLGMMIFEAGNGTLNGTYYEVAVGGDLVQSPTNNSAGYNYSLTGFSTVDVAVLSAAGMDGGDGGWPVLFGNTPLSPSQLTLAFDEDLIGDSDRSHTTEQVAYIAFGSASGAQNFPTPLDEPILAAEPVKLYPNPAVDQVYLEFEPTESGIAHIKVYDLSGRVAFKESLKVTEVRRVERIDLVNLSEGYYLVEIMGAGLKETKKFIKTR